MFVGRVLNGNMLAGRMSTGSTSGIMFLIIQACMMILEQLHPEALKKQHAKNREEMHNYGRPRGFHTIATIALCVDALSMQALTSFPPGPRSAKSRNEA
jgi:hypothetical protein